MRLALGKWRRGWRPLLGRVLPLNKTFWYQSGVSSIQHSQRSCQALIDDSSAKESETDVNLPPGADSRTSWRLFRALLPLVASLAFAIPSTQPTSSKTSRLSSLLYCDYIYHVSYPLSLYNPARAAILQPFNFPVPHSRRLLQSVHNRARPALSRKTFKSRPLAKIRTFSIPSGQHFHEGNSISRFASLQLSPRARVSYSDVVRSLPDSLRVEDCLFNDSAIAYGLTKALKHHTDDCCSITVQLSTSFPMEQL